MSRQNQQSLLEEYRGCIEKVNHVDRMIWQTAAVIFPITLAGIAYFGLSSTHNINQFIVVLVLGIGSITLLLAWYFLSRTWYFYQSIAFYRLHEIEEELAIFHYRYSIFLRLSGNERKSLIKNLDDNEKEKYQKLESRIEDIPRIGLRKAMTLVSLIFSFGWLIIIIREVFLTF